MSFDSLDAMKIKLLIATTIIAVAGCASRPPSNFADSCSILDEKSGWYKAAKNVRDKYGTPINVQLAIIRQESGFKHDAKPDRNHLLWVIPWGRKSSAYGYAQVKDATWDWYREQTGNHGADRDRFAGPGSGVVRAIGRRCASVERNRMGTGRGVLGNGRHERCGRRGFDGHVS